jgi:hypothetical protein
MTLLSHGLTLLDKRRRVLRVLMMMTSRTLGWTVMVWAILLVAIPTGCEVAASKSRFRMVQV